MKLSRTQLRRIISEELINDDYMRGVPEFVFKEATRKFVQEIKKHVETHVLLDKSNDKEEQLDAISSMNDVMEDLETTVYEVLEQKLWSLMERM